ncbi:MAG: M3 family metallopeptidase [Pseudomonadota bacterium]
MSQENPLLAVANSKNEFPRFDLIVPEHVEPALDTILSQNRDRIQQLIRDISDPDWENFMAPLEDLDDRLEKMWSPVSHLNSVDDNDLLRQAYEACLPKLSEYSSEMGQNKDLFDKVSQLRNSGTFDELNQAQKKSIENDLRAFRLSGIDLSKKDQDRYREISRRLSELSNRFSQNVLDSTDAWHLDISEQSQLEGIPETAISLAKSVAERAQQDGWRFTLQAPSYIPFMTFCADRALREEMYCAYVTRASEEGPNAGSFDNGPLIVEILQLRREISQILGFENFAAYSLETKMADTPEQVESFLRDLAARSRPAAENEWRQLNEFAQQECGIDELKAWDLAWVSEKLQQKLFDFSPEELRAYFPLPRVLSGMFETVSRLFSIRIDEIKPTEAERPAVWDDSVSIFRISDPDGQIRGYFYTDLFARSTKRGGAWMADCASRRKSSNGTQLPVAFLTCNFTSPVDDKPALLTHDEVMTLFHEFGHSLHHMLTKIDVSGVSGINGVPWDAVELPSQFLENWCWERGTLDLISGHVETGETLPDHLLERMRAGKNFQSAMQMIRQVEFSLFDLLLHSQDAEEGFDSVQSLLDSVRRQIAVSIPPAFNRFQNSFGHIFAGGYAAGYYSYKWAEVLSADAFSLFEERGVFDEKTGHSFLTNILEAGGAEEPMTLFKAFRGREPTVDALLRHSGLDTASSSS